jgi:uncharacterized membrane protein YoaK (UPF0700 family)
MQLGLLLAIVGGFLDAYTYVSRHGVFANAQTGNVVLLAIAASHRHWAQGLRHLPAIVAFVVGVATAETLGRPRLARVVRRPERAAIGVEIIALAIVGSLPLSVPDEVVTVVVSFVASLQVSMFRILERWSYNTAMTTGNLRSAAQAAFVAIADHNHESAEQAEKLFSIVGAFLLGAVFGGLVTIHLGGRASWIAAGVLVGCLGLLVLDERSAATPPT